MKDLAAFQLKQSDNVTTGKIYSDILKKERKGLYLRKNCSSNTSCYKSN